MKILMIAYYFPPDSSSGSYRPLYFSRHLQNMGNDIYVLTSKVEDYLEDQPKDNNLLNDTVDKIHIDRTRVFRPREAIIKLKNHVLKKKSEDSKNTGRFNHQTNNTAQNKSLFQSIKDTITDVLASPDPHIGWFPSAVLKGAQLIRKKRIDVIYATGSPWTCFIVGVSLKWMTGKPLVIDFRDPWVANPGFLVRSRYIQSIEKIMERMVISFADIIVANTNELRINFLERFPKLKEDQVVTITNGFESYHENINHKNDRITLTHAGALYFSRNPKNLLKATINIIEKGIVDKDRLRFNFLGGISINDPELDRVLEHPALKKVVSIFPRLPYEEACSYQAQSDILFLIQPDFPLQVPRKLYEYVSYSKPILGITNLNGATANVINKNGIGVVSLDSVEDIEKSLTHLISNNYELNPFKLNQNTNFLNKELTNLLYKYLSETVQQHLESDNKLWV